MKRWRPEYPMYGFNQQTGFGHMNAFYGIDINWAVFNETRRKFGGHFFRHFEYLTQDGPRSIQAIEDAMRSMNAAKMVLPANRLAEDAFLFGAQTLGELCERIETHSQQCVAQHKTPDVLLRDILALRPAYFTSIARLEREVSPLVKRKGKDATTILTRRATMQYV
jgi:histidine phosphotransfer protein HptB